MDRHQVNETFFVGTSEPSATMCSDTSRYFPGPEWRTKWATHDVEQANQLLDQIGLTAKDEDGYRLHPNGQDRLRLDIQSASSKVDFPPIGEAIKRQWRQIGIDATNQTVDGALLAERVLANHIMLQVNSIGTADPFLSPYKLLPASTVGISGTIGLPYVEWFLSDGSKGTEPPESMESLKAAMEIYRQGLETPEDARIDLGKQIFELHVDQVWSIGVVGFGMANYGLYYASNELGNVPARVINDAVLLKTPANTLPMTFFYQEA